MRGVATTDVGPAPVATAAAATGNGRAGLGLAVRPDLPVPKITTPEALKPTVVSADSLAQPKPYNVARAYPFEYPLGVPLTQSPGGQKPFDRYARIKDDAFSGHVVRRELP